MSRQSIERLIWMATSIILVLFAREMFLLNRGGSIGRTIRGIDLRNPARVPGMSMFQADSLDSAAAQIVEHDPFRLERKPASVPFNVSPPGNAATIAAPIPTIRIVLQGTIGGPPWHAIISGVPGHSGAIVVASGDTLGGVSIRKVSRDSVTLRVKDSTWTVAMSKAGEA